MTELFTNVRDGVKQIADLSWKVALAQNNPADAAAFLDTITNFYKNTYCTEEEVEYLRFYFNMKMQTELNKE